MYVFIPFPPAGATEFVRTPEGGYWKTSGRQPDITDGVQYEPETPHCEHCGALVDRGCCPACGEYVY